MENGLGFCLGCRPRTVKSQPTKQTSHRLGYNENIRVKNCVQSICQLSLLDLVFSSLLLLIKVWIVLKKELGLGFSGVSLLILNYFFETTYFGCL